MGLKKHDLLAEMCLCEEEESHYYEWARRLRVLERHNCLFTWRRSRTAENPMDKS